MIELDRSGRSIVAVCRCGARDVFATDAAADRWVATHLATAHPMPDSAAARVVASLHQRQRRG